MLNMDAIVIQNATYSKFISFAKTFSSKLDIKINSASIAYSFATQYVITLSSGVLAQQAEIIIFV